MWPRTYVLRPQVVWWSCSSRFCGRCGRLKRGAPKRLAIVPFVFAAWVNLHGGWIVGCGVLTLWIALTLGRHDVRISPRLLLITEALTLVATLANPYGWQLWRFLAATVRPDRPNIDDWRPLFQSGMGFIVPWTICAVLAAVAFVKRRPQIPWSHTFIVAGLGVASIRVSRLDVFFSLSVIMLLAPQIAAAAGASSLERARLWTKGAIAAAVLVAATWSVVFFVVRHQFTCVLLNVPWMPERDAAAVITTNHLRGRLLTWSIGDDMRSGISARISRCRSTAAAKPSIRRVLRDHLRLYSDPDQKPLS